MIAMMMAVAETEFPTDIHQHRGVNSKIPHQ